MRLVNSLDRTHQQKCAEAVVTFKDNVLKVVAATREDLTLEARTFEEKGKFFEGVFHVHPVFKQKKQL